MDLLRRISGDGDLLEDLLRWISGDGDLLEDLFKRIFGDGDLLKDLLRPLLLLRILSESGPSGSFEFGGLN